MEAAAPEHRESEDAQGPQIGLPVAASAAVYMNVPKKVAVRCDGMRWDAMG